MSTGVAVGTGGWLQLYVLCLLLVQFGPPAVALYAKAHMRYGGRGRR